MAIETVYASSHITGGFSNPSNAVGNTPLTWAGDLNTNSSYTSRWAISDPVDPLTTSATQTINVWAKKGSNSGTPTIALNLYENGTLVGSILAATNVTSTSGQTLTGTFNSSAITNRNDVEIEVVQTATGGSPSARNSAQIAYIEWVADTTAVSGDVTVDSPTAQSISIAGLTPTTTTTSTVDSEPTTQNIPVTGLTPTISVVASVTVSSPSVAAITIGTHQPYIDAVDPSTMSSLYPNATPSLTNNWRQWNDASTAPGGSTNWSEHINDDIESTYIYVPETANGAAANVEFTDPIDVDTSKSVVVYFSHTKGTASPTTQVTLRDTSTATDIRQVLTTGDENHGQPVVWLLTPDEKAAVTDWGSLRLNFAYSGTKNPHIRWARIDYTEFVSNVDTEPNAQAITVAGLNPGISSTSSVDVSVSTQAISVVGQDPFLSITGSQNVEVTTTQDVVVAGLVPTVSGTSTTPVTVNPSRQNIPVAGLAPDIAASEFTNISVSAQAVAVAGQNPSISANATGLLYLRPDATNTVNGTWEDSDSGTTQANFYTYVNDDNDATYVGTVAATGTSTNQNIRFNFSNSDALGDVNQDMTIRWSIDPAAGDSTEYTVTLSYGAFSVKAFNTSGYSTNESYTLTEAERDNFHDIVVNSSGDSFYEDLTIQFSFGNNTTNTLRQQISWIRFEYYPPTSGYPAKVWDGSVWQPAVTKVWNGSEWVVGSIGVYDGTDWS